MKRIDTVFDVAACGLCTGCGACAYADPVGVRMLDVPSEGRRPAPTGRAGDASRAADAVRACPGLDQSRTDAAPAGAMAELAESWGPVLEMWEGWAADPAMRFRASSGGAISAMATWAIERGGMHGVLHVASKDGLPHVNEAVLSRSRAQIVSRSGSRYAPASPCEGLQLVEDAPAPCVFVGKPCDCLAVDRLRRIRPKLDANVGLVFGFFCAGTPTTAGTMEMLRRMGVDDVSKLKSLRYRGDGWPGKATAVIDVDGREETRQLTYEQSWGDVLARHKQWRCNLCPDRTGETADLSFGDPWWNGVPKDAPGRSMILVRTERGRRALGAAVAAGYVVAAPAESWKLRASQPGFPKVRGAIFGRVAAMRLLAMPVPRHEKAALLRHWMRELTAVEKAKSFLGTIRRVLVRGRLRRRDVAAPNGVGRA